MPLKFCSPLAIPFLHHHSCSSRDPSDHRNLILQTAQFSRFLLRAMEEIPPTLKLSFFILGHAYYHHGIWRCFTCHYASHDVEKFSTPAKHRSDRSEITRLKLISQGTLWTSTASFVGRLVPTRKYLSRTSRNNIRRRYIGQGMDKNTVNICKRG